MRPQWASWAGLPVLTAGVPHRLRRRPASDRLRDRGSERRLVRAPAPAPPAWSGPDHLRPAARLPECWTRAEYPLPPPGLAIASRAQGGPPNRRRTRPAQWRAAGAPPPP